MLKINEKNKMFYLLVVLYFDTDTLIYALV